MLSDNGFLFQTFPCFQPFIFDQGKPSMMRLHPYAGILEDNSMLLQMLLCRCAYFIASLSYQPNLSSTISTDTKC